ncbi:hypothetical protein B0T26DRAFT_802929 [Lasiosphaeria miniovina]|uniref:Uncharacterized protein n=1 Tax=Lasiosphaeria miniovina TaxID=1954250 RepID=A0AA40ALC7_9PEZI|nr:uncharacterized protein B0T26DRAFT_802929 [Lasiosphaeria miniovina]KAK0717954.1 hypothetical protein B0T26DRAFT_802929 [Lasiosphaeria miniovina]
MVDKLLEFMSSSRTTTRQKPSTESIIVQKHQHYSTTSIPNEQLGAEYPVNVSLPPSSERPMALASRTDNSGNSILRLFYLCPPRDIPSGCADRRRVHHQIYCQSDQEEMVELDGDGADTTVGGKWTVVGGIAAADSGMAVSVVLGPTVNVF